MRFIGQHHIVNQLRFILPNLYKNRDKSANFLLKGPSGYGKTEMALGICRYLAGSSFQVFLGESHPFNFIKRVIFIDEIHTVKNLERLYHEMDSGRRVFVFATNIDGNLPEAFVTRCAGYEFIFTDYDDDELILIARSSVKFHASDEQFLEVVKAGNRNPRVIKALCKNLETYFTENRLEPYSMNFKVLIEGVFDIKDGLDPLARKYIEVLESAGGTASLFLLKTLLHVDENSVKNLEPILVKKGIIKITSKGRSLNYDSR